MESEGINEVDFKKHYVDLMAAFRNFIAVKDGSNGNPSEEDKVDEEDLEVILAINKLSSNQRGVKLVPPVLVHKQVYLYTFQL